MKKLLLIALMAVSFAAKSQTTTEKLIDLPTKEGKLFFEGVVQVDSTFKKEQLYSKSREWFVNYYKSAKDVLQMDDRADGKLIGKGLHPYDFLNGINVSKIDLNLPSTLPLKMANTVTRSMILKAITPTAACYHQPQQSLKLILTTNTKN